MKIKKIIIIIIFLFILTGCTSTVNLEITDNIVHEQIIIDDQVTPKSSFREYQPVYYKDNVADTEPDIKENKKEYYKKEIIDNKINYSYAFRINDYNESNAMKSVFSSSAIVFSEATGITELYTSSDGVYVFDIYPNLTKLEVNITTELEVEENNADSVSGNTYTWVFTPNNNKKNIYLRMRNYIYKRIHVNEDKNDNKTDDSSKSNNNNDSNTNKYSGNSNIKADIKYKEKASKEEKQKENFNFLVIALVLLFAFLIIIFLIGKISIKKNR